LFTMEQTGRDGATAKSEVALRTAQPSTLANLASRLHGVDPPVGERCRDEPIAFMHKQSVVSSDQLLFEILKLRDVVAMLLKKCQLLRPRRWIS